MSEREMFEASFKRPENYFSLSSQEQWDIDKKLGILDWEGKDLSEEDKKRFKEHYKAKISNPKQVIVVRKDLNMRKGKIAAQVAHASMKIFLDWGDWVSDDCFEINNLPDRIVQWMKGSFTKIVVSVNSEEEIYNLAKRATDLDIPHAVIIDHGFTEFHGNKTTTCIAIGPDESEKIDELTGDLPLI